MERWLADEPVTAYREPWVGRVRRWMRRHRSAVVTTVAILVTATVGLAVGLVAVSVEKNHTESRPDLAESPGADACRSQREGGRCR